MKKEEEFLHGHRQKNKLIKIDIENQRWLYYILIGSFSFLILLNFILPDLYFVKRPVYNIGDGFFGLILTFFGVLFILTIYHEGSIKYLLLRIVLSLIFFYFGLPLLFSFQW